MKGLTLLIFIALTVLSCTGNRKPTSKQDTMIIDSTKQYGYNRDFLNRYVPVLELRNGEAAIALIPSWQGRVMTSTAMGDKGFSFGWINRDLIASGKLQPHINAFGGEERIWLGPEGGQFSTYFPKGKPFTYENWQVPAFMDTMLYEVVSSSDTSVHFGADITTENYSGTPFSLRIDREVTLLDAAGLEKQTSVNTRGLSCVAYKSDNRLTNKGTSPWKKETGLLSVWMLGMYNPSPSVVVTIPVKAGEEKDLGPAVNDNYFGRIAPDRLKVSGNHIFFRCDGKSRGKIGIPPLRSTGKMGSYDPDNKILTLLICRQPEGVTDYVNSAWQIQDKPYSGDALNSYNDGPLEDGSQMGPFYELETSSPALELKPGESLSHVQFTIHLTGDPALLDKVALDILGVGLDEIEKAF